MNELNPLWFFLIFLLIFPLFFVGLWAFVCLLMSALGGWGSLAKAYPLVGLPEGEPLGGRSARIGLANYRRILTFTAGSTHLHVAVLAIFRLGHDPFSVPWSDITVARHRSLFSQDVELRCWRVPKIRILIDTGTGAALAQASGGQLVVPPPDD